MAGEPVEPTTDFLEALASRVLIADGAVGTELARRLRQQGAVDPGVLFDSGGWPDLDQLTIDRPDLVREVHEDYCAAGANIIGTNTFQATLHGRLGSTRTASVRDLNARAASLACEVRDLWRRRLPREPRFVAGVMGPGLPPSSTRSQQVADAYVEQALGLLDGGADVLSIETAHDADWAQGVLRAVARASAESNRHVPVMLSVAPDGAGRPAAGRRIEHLLRRLPWPQVAVVGVNCGVGLGQARAALERIARPGRHRVSFQPSAGLPGADGSYATTPDEFGRTVADAAHRGLARIVGGCCGTTPEHIARLAALVREGAPGFEALSDCTSG